MDSPVEPVKTISKYNETQHMLTIFENIVTAIFDFGRIDENNFRRAENLKKFRQNSTLKKEKSNGNICKQGKLQRCAFRVRE